jgi:hypothetical protein
LILLRRNQRFVGREYAVALLGQKLISQWSLIRPPGRGATPDFSAYGAAYGEMRQPFCRFLLYDSDFPPGNLNLFGILYCSKALIWPESLDFFW